MYEQRGQLNDNLQVGVSVFLDFIRVIERVCACACMPMTM